MAKKAGGAVPAAVPAASAPVDSAPVAAAPATVSAVDSAPVACRQRGSQMLACPLCTLSQASMLNEKTDDALQAGDGVIVIFRNKGDTFSEASALLLSADALLSKRSCADAKAAAQEALNLFEEVGDSKGKEIASSASAAQPSTRPAV
eukprot:10855369-Heterocapsa_arctica.AAC.2